MPLDTSQWLAVVPFALACLLPGAGIAAVVVRRLRMDAVTFVALSFALTVALVAVFAQAAHYAGLLLASVTGVWTALAVGGGILVVREWRGLLRTGVDPAPGGLLIALAAGVVALVQRPWLYANSDIFYHLAAVRELLLTGRVLPTDPIYGTIAPLDPTSGVWHTMQAAFALPAGLDPVQLYPAAMFAGAAVYALCVWALVRTLVRDDRVADACTLLVIAGITAFDLRPMAYPNRVSFALALLFAALLVRVVREELLGQWTWALLAGAAGFSVVSMHLGGAELAGILGAIIVVGIVVGAAASRRLREEAGFSRASQVVVACAIAFVPALPVLIPRLGGLGGSLVLGEEGIDRLAGQVVTMAGGLRVLKPGGSMGPEWVFYAGSAAAILAIVVGLRRAEPGALLAGVIGLLPALLLTNPLVTPVLLERSAHMAFRLAMLLQVAPWIALAWAAGEAAERWRVVRRAFLPAAVAVAVASAGWCMLVGRGAPWPSTVPGPRSIVADWAQDRRLVWGTTAYKDLHLLASAGERPVVAAEAVLAYQLTGMAPASAMAVLESHSPYAVEPKQGEERRRDLALLLDAASSVGARDAILRRWDVSFVAFDDNAKYAQAAESMRMQPDLFEVAFATRGLTLLRVKDR